MPRILRHTPRWLSRPAPGFALFNEAGNERLVNGSSKNGKTGPMRTVAHRGTEVFVAVGNQLRWSDLELLREQEYHDQQARESYNHETEDRPSSTWPACRTLKVPVHRDIHQLTISPSGDYLAILTTHTVHVALLPDPTQLSVEDSAPLKLKTFQVGPTAHVLERSPVLSALWHPLAASGCCLVTATQDAVVRLWDLNKDNRWSFDNPGLSLDLRKLANGAFQNGDYSPSKYGISAGFSPDQFDMEVASACFGGSGLPDERGWASMTLWIAMNNGDLYALCPFLPSHWALTKNQISQLLVTVESTGTPNQGQEFCEPSASTMGQQTQWATNILNQQKEQELHMMDADGCTYERPSTPGAIPALQGPFHVEPDSDQIFDVTDIFAVAASLTPEQENIMDRVDVDDDDSYNPAQVLCLATSDGYVHVCLDIEGVQGRWLPHRDEDANAVAKINHERLPELLLVETIKISQSQQLGWPTFTPNANSRFAAYVTCSQGVSYVRPTISLSRLSDELEEPVDQSGEYRLKMIAQSSEAEVQPLIKLNDTIHSSEAFPAACIHVNDPGFGDFLLTIAKGQPHALQLDFSNVDLLFEGDEFGYGSGDEVNALFPEETRPIYQPPPELWAETTLPLFAEDQKTGAARQLMEKELRLAPATVNLMMEAHRLLGSETEKIQDSVSSLFQRCQRMQDELRAQLERVGEISGRIDSVLEDNAEVLEDHQEQDEDDNANVARRLEEAQSRHHALQDRYARLRGKVGQLDNRPLNDKERPWMQEIEKLDHSVKNEAKEDGAACPTERYKIMSELKEDLISRSELLKGPDEQPEVDSSPRRHKSGISRVTTMLERETALIDATAERLEELRVHV